jgi:hypothetical protein
MNSFKMLRLYNVDRVLMSELSIGSVGSCNIAQSYGLSLTIGHSKGQRVERGDLSERSLWIPKEQSQASRYIYRTNRYPFTQLLIGLPSTLPLQEKQV